MKITEFYSYFVNSRRDLWKVLEAAPDATLSSSLIDNVSFSCIKDLMFHTIICEDAWLHLDIFREPMLIETFPDLDKLKDGNSQAITEVKLTTILDYAKTVESKTLQYFAYLKENELERIVTLYDDPDKKYAVGDILWHVMTHEMRHTAQIIMLLRSKGVIPPGLDLIGYVPLSDVRQAN